MSAPAIPEGWTIQTDYIGHRATHRDYDASWEGEEDGWQDNGLSVWAATKGELPALIAEVEAEHPHFDRARSAGEA